MEPNQNPTTDSNLPFSPTPRRSLLPWIVVTLSLIALGIIGFVGAKNLTGSKSPSSTPTPTSAPPVTSSERQQVGDQPQPVSLLQVTELTATKAKFDSASVDTLQVNGDLSVTGNGTFGGALTAASFQGSGAGLTGVNAALLNGQPGSYYLNFANHQGTLSDAQSPNSLARRNTANTFTAANTFNATTTFNGAVVFGQPLAVSQGGIGTSSLTQDGVLIGQGTGSITTVTAGAAGQCLLSTIGSPTFAACPGAGAGVSSLDGLTGALVLANSTGGGSTITIDDATTTAKGIASFNTTNFSVSSGAVNTIQNIHTGATPTFVGVNTNTITPSAALTVGSTSQAFTLRGTAASTITATSGASTTTLGFTTPTANRTISLPNESGTLCLQSSTNCGFAAASGSGNYIQSTATIQTNANIAISGAADSDITLLLKQRPTQSADLFRIVTSGDVPMLQLNTFGSLIQAGSAEFQSHVGIGFPGASTSGFGLSVFAPASTDVALQVNGNAGQTGDIIQFNSNGNRRVTYSAAGTLSVRVDAAQTADALQVRDSANNPTFSISATGHLASSGSAPSISSGAAACTTPTVSVSGTDTSGLVTVTSGTGCGATGKLATITFANAYAVAPRVTLTAATSTAAGLTQIYVDSGTISTTAFDLNTNTAPADSTTYKWYYHVIQ